MLDPNKPSKWWIITINIWKSYMCTAGLNFFQVLFQLLFQQCSWLRGSPIFVSSPQATCQERNRVEHLQFCILFQMVFSILNFIMNFICYTYTSKCLPQDFCDYDFIPTVLKTPCVNQFVKCKTILHQKKWMRSEIDFELPWTCIWMHLPVKESSEVTCTCLDC